MASDRDRLIAGAIPDWPGAHATEVEGAGVVIGRLDALSAALPVAHDRDLVDAGRRRGEALRLFLRRRAVLRLLVGRRLGVDADGVVLGYDERGAPVVRAPAGRLRVSVSARRDLAAFALASGPVGVDLEPLADPGPIDVVLTPAERLAVAGAPDVAAARLRLWTAKEAYLKALGTGLARDPAAIEVVEGPGHAFDVRDRDRAGTGSGRWFETSLASVPLVVALWIGDASRWP